MFEVSKKANESKTHFEWISPTTYTNNTDSWGDKVKL